MLIAFLHRRGIRLPRWVGIVFLLISALALVSGVAMAQGQHAFVYMLGADTLGVERVTSTEGLVIGDMQMRGQPRVQWTATLTGPGRMRSVSLAAFANASADAAVLQRALMTLEGDTVRADISVGTNTTKQVIATKRDAFILMNASIAMIDLLMDRARSTTPLVDTIPVFLVTGGQTSQAIVTVSGDSADVATGPLHAAVRLGKDGRVLEVNIPAQRLRVTRVEGAALATLKVGATDYGAPAGAPYRSENVSIPGLGGHRLAGTFTVPTERTGRIPAVVTISGSGPQDRDEYIPLVPGYRPYRQFADTLGRRGIAMLRYDDRGTGESSGDFAKATSADFADDVRSIVQWLRTRPEIDPDRIMLMGHSEGGLIAPLVAAGDPRLAGIVLLAGPSEKGEDILRFQMRNLALQDSTLSTTARDSAIKAIDGNIAILKRENPWMRYFLEYDPLPTARKVKVPVIVVQGGTDQQVTPKQAEALGVAFKAGGNRDVTVKVFPNRNHLFLDDPNGSPLLYTRLTNGRVGGDILGLVTDWVVQRGSAGARKVLQ